MSKKNNCDPGYAAVFKGLLDYIERNINEADAIADEFINQKALNYLANFRDPDDFPKVISYLCCNERFKKKFTVTKVYQDVFNCRLDYEDYGKIKKIRSLCQALAVEFPEDIEATLSGLKEDGLNLVKAESFSTHQPIISVFIAASIYCNSDKEAQKKILRLLINIVGDYTGIAKDYSGPLF